MTRRPWQYALAGILIFTASCAAASEPGIEGSINGIELCPQYVCQAAIFVGTFRGTVDGRLAIGTWAVAVQHDEPLPFEGESREITSGQWMLNVWVLRGFFFRRVTFSGQVSPGGELTWAGENEFGINATFLMGSSSGSDAILLRGLLSHNAFPPSIQGRLSSP